ncbi:Cationic amino acid transporter 1 [Glycine soja]
MERERVRNIRELVQMISQQRGSRGSRRDAQLHEGAQADQAHDVVANNDESQPEHVRWDMSRLRRRQALVDLLVKIERERQRELQGLFEHRAVSDFAHRNRIQLSLSRTLSLHLRALMETWRLKDRILTRYNESAEVGEMRARSSHQMKKTLNWWDLMWLGIWAVIGAEIFVLTGIEAREVGPAVVLSYVVSGFSAMLSVFCYIEFAVEIPFAGSVSVN